MACDHIGLEIFTRTAKWDFAAQPSNRAHASGHSADLARVKAGDLIVCRVVSIGRHEDIELAEGRYYRTYPRDPVVAARAERSAF